MAMSASVLDETTEISEKSNFPSRELLIHWRGERDVGYSKPFRHLEFTSALLAELQVSVENEGMLNFQNALNYIGQAAMADVSKEHFNEAMQYISISEDCSKDVVVTRDAIISAVERSSLVHACYEVIASANNINDLAPLAIQDGGFADMFKGGLNKDSTWCFRARNYRDLATSDEADTAGKEKRYSSNARSMKLEQEGLKALTELLIRFGGKVDLLNPDCKVYIFDGLVGNEKVLARRIAVGPRTSIIAPATRICITNTPLEPIASFSLCNVARIRNGMAILDPYAGSCATLLAASMITPQSRTVGIEIAHNGLVNRVDVRKDFSSRNLTQPKALLHGDSTDVNIRKEAKAAIGNGPFDAIIADPPYGIRESLSYSDKSPLEELFASIATDRKNEDRLLREGGRLVAFVAVTDEETLDEMLPNQDLTAAAGLEFEVSREQTLNDKLSRWLVSYVCRT
jgi:tRNA G10  N-methylase Trm11